MKRFSAVLLVSVSMMCSVFAQKVETAYTFPIDDEFPVYKNKNPYEGSDSGLGSLIVDGSNYYFINGISGDWYLSSYGKRPEIILNKEGFSYAFPFKVDLPNGFIFGYLKNREASDLMQVFFNVDGEEYFYEGSSIPDVVDQVYETGNTLFIQTQDKQLVSIEFSDNGTYTVRNAEETLRWLESGKGEELGWSQLIYENINYGNILGDINLSNVSTAYSKGVLTNLTMKSPKYAGFSRISELKGYDYLNKDSKGLIYLIKYESDNGPFSYSRQGPNIRFSIAVNDIWTRQVYFYEDYAPNEWNPPRDANGKIIGSYSWTVAPDGNIYFTDADVEKGEYQIKRVINRWWDDMGINDRIIGQMNTNHIPLLTAMNGSQNDGYCFENDFVWVTEQSKDKKWSKIKKIDGREGWIETKYIDINTMVPVTNASLGITTDQSPAAKILKAADNLRLRKTELTSSEVITTMLKGTPVKIVATGRKETIDGITGNWVQIEVQSGGKDRNGNPIPAGTTGWCFGGYLE